MAGVTLQGSLLNQQPIAARNKSMKTTGPRKALVDIKNLRQSEQTKSAQKPQKLLRNQTPGSKKFLIHVDRSSVNTPSLKPTHRLKGGPTPFKIYVDKPVVTEKQAQLRRKEKHYETTEIEYMPPCTDKDFDIPLPEYVQRVCDSKPIFNIDLSTHRIPNDHGDTDPIAEETLKFILNQNIITPSSYAYEDPTEDLFDTSEDFDDSALLYQLDHDESFSLETLDRELRAAKLEIPKWLSLETS